MTHSFAGSIRAAGVLIALLGAAAGAQQPAATSEGLLLDSLLNTRISTVSKYAQTTTEAPASVTIVSSDEIRDHGYRNLTEVLVAHYSTPGGVEHLQPAIPQDGRVLSLSLDWTF